MNKFYDVIVVGAGPAGSTAAKYAAEKGISVLLLEKDEKPGTPVRCGEAVNKKRLQEFINPDPGWISAIINSFSLNAPDGSEVILKFEEEGFILDRSKFDYQLALNAVKQGADLKTSAYVYDLIKENDSVAGVKVETDGESFEIKSRIVIAADGVESRVGRFAGLKTFADFREMECCIQVNASGINNIETSTCYFYFGKEYAPGGYLWIFPKGNNSANIGLGIDGLTGKKRSALSYLNDFLNTRYHDIIINNKIAGGVPCTPTLKKITSPGIMLAGDAARQVNPLSGGGITSGMKAGLIAGKTAAHSILNNDPDYISMYEKEWHSEAGKRHEVYNRIKEGVFNLSDKQLNGIAHSVLKIPTDKRTLGRLFTFALMNNPSLLKDVAKVFIV